MRRNFQFTDLHFGLIPPPEIQRKQNSFAKTKNLAIFTPLILKRSGKDSGFGKLEVKLQTRLVTSLFLGSPSSVWSISTAYNHLVKENPSACSIFWSGDFFCPEKEYKSYKNYDLVLCLTPITHQKIPQAFSGAKIHFHMCSQLSERKEDSDTYLMNLHCSVGIFIIQKSGWLCRNIIRPEVGFRFTFSSN